MWNTEIDDMDGGRVRRVGIRLGDKPVSYGEILEHWRNDHAFREFFIGLLADAPYRAYLWETPPITKANAMRPFEFVFVDSPSLAGRSPDPITFASYFENADAVAETVVFANIGSDAVLVAPCPQGQSSAYTHLAAFTRAAPLEQQHAFWRTVGSTVANHLSNRPLWLSTNGLGVSWLHVRLDTRPKYYNFRPFAKAD